MEERFSFDSVVREHHIYKEVWSPVVGECLLYEQEFGNIHDRYAVAIVQIVASSLSSKDWIHVERITGSVCQHIQILSATGVLPKAP